jgi:hypothetical protein
LIVHYLDEISGRLEDLAELLEKPQGYVHPIKITVTEAQVLDLVTKPPYTLLFAVTLFNDGPDEVYPSVNVYQRKTPLKPGESVRFEYTSPRIERLFLDVDAGKRANVRGFGIY